MGDARIHLFGEITPELAVEVISELRGYAADDGVERVELVVNSPGGCACSTYAMLDEMWAVDREHGVMVDVVVRGEASSAAAFLVVGATGRRLAGPYSILMLHRAKIEEGYHDARSVQECLDRTDAMMFQLLEQRTPQDAAYWANRIGHGDLWLSPDEAFAEGLIDGIG